MIPLFVWPMVTAAALLWIDHRTPLPRSPWFPSVVFGLGALTGFLTALI